MPPHAGQNSSGLRVRRTAVRASVIRQAVLAQIGVVLLLLTAQLRDRALGHFTTTGLIGPPTLPITGSGLAEKKNS